MGGNTSLRAYPITPFFLDVFEVTVAAYRECINEGKCTPPGGAMVSSNCNMIGPGEKDTHPVNCIDWKQANDFCAWAGRRLPTEVEWEFAAGGPKEAARKYPWGSDEAETGAGAQLCWLRTDGTCEVGRYPHTLMGHQTCAGVADLAGNVLEWTNDEFEEIYVYPPKRCEPGSSTHCSVRGGSWNGPGNQYVQAGFRAGYKPANGDSYTGVRCAQSAP